jgi:hypothetical protein
MQTTDVQEDRINGLTSNTSRGWPSMFQVFRLPLPSLLLLIFASSLQFQACLSDIIVVMLACKKLSSVSFALLIGQERKKKLCLDFFWGECSIYLRLWLLMVPSKSSYDSVPSKSSYNSVPNLVFLDNKQSNLSDFVSFEKMLDALFHLK